MKKKPFSKEFGGERGLGLPHAERCKKNNKEDRI